jgi:threo-3-hydroxy-D-aspartate ammonia-lyase
MIEVDSDGHRSGVKADDPKLIEIASVLHDGGAALKGVMTHAGSSYDLDTPEALRQLAEQERHECVRAAEKLRAAGKPCPEVSVGSTPTALSATELDGVTEVRAGVYAVFDLVMANVGVCAPQDVALSVLTTVIGHQAEKGWTIVDAGWMAMSRDRGTQRQKVDYGYGAVCDADGNLIEGLMLASANQEHGIVSRMDGKVDPDMAMRLPIGRRLRILPNHACATGAQFSEYQAITAHGVAQQWRRFDGW